MNLENFIIILWNRNKKSKFAIIEKLKATRVFKELNSDKVIEFFEKNEIGLETLKENFNENFPETYPQIYIDFDSKKFISQYGEMDYEFENHAPANFSPEYGNFEDLISPEMKYCK